MVRCAILYHLYNLKNVKNTHGGVLILVIILVILVILVNFSTEVIIQSWKSATGNKHSAYQKQWIHFSSERRQDPLHPQLNHVLNILHSYQIRNLGYSVLNTIRSMLSSFVEIYVIEVVKYPIICRYMKDAYNMNPSLPKHNFTWNVRAVVKYLINASSEKLYDLSKKLATLTAILCGQRPH